MIRQPTSLHRFWKWSTNIATSGLYCLLYISSCLCYLKYQVDTINYYVNVNTICCNSLFLLKIESVPMKHKHSSDYACFGVGYTLTSDTDTDMTPIVTLNYVIFSNYYPCRVRYPCMWSCFIDHYCLTWREVQNSKSPPSKWVFML